MKNIIRFLSFFFLSLSTTFSHAQKQNSKSDSLRNGADSSKSLFYPIASAVEFPPFRFEKLKIGGIFSMDYYANPYLQVFGGDPIRIPIKTGYGFWG